MAYKQQTFIFYGLGAGSVGSKCQHEDKALFQVVDFSLYLHMVGLLSSVASLYKTAHPIQEGSLMIYAPLRDPPTTFDRVRISIYEFWEDTNVQTTARLKTKPPAKPRKNCIPRLSVHTPRLTITGEVNLVHGNIPGEGDRHLLQLIWFIQFGHDWF